MSDDRRFLSVLTGSFSTPAGANPTVAMVEAAYRALGLNARYVNCDVASDHLGAAVRGAQAMGWVGFNCSLPHKVTVIEHLDGLGASAELIGAVNCVVMRDGRLIGENTDGQGFLASLRTVADPAGRHLVLFGAGGAARAIAVEAALAGVARLTIVNRNVAHAEALAGVVSARTATRAQALPATDAMRVPEDADILVNATSIGLGDAEARLALDVGTLRPGLVVADVIPNPPRTALIRDAEARGCTVLDGLGMLVNQALVAIELWTGRRADAAVMRAELERLL
jgi:shikimate dehydrogenase